MHACELAYTLVSTYTHTPMRAFILHTHTQGTQTCVHPYIYSHMWGGDIIISVHRRGAGNAGGDALCWRERVCVCMYVRVYECMCVGACVCGWKEVDDELRWGAGCDVTVTDRVEAEDLLQRNGDAHRDLIGEAGGSYRSAVLDWCVVVSPSTWSLKAFDGPLVAVDGRLPCRCHCWPRLPLMYSIGSGHARGRWR